MILFLLINYNEYNPQGYGVIDVFANYNKAVETRDAILDNPDHEHYSQQLAIIERYLIETKAPNKQ